MELLNVDIKSAGYAENPEAIKGIRFRLEQGQVVGLIGPNGAGKSTAIKGILGLLPKLEGTVQFTEGYQRYAYIPEQPVFYEELTLWEHLELARSAYEMEQEQFVRRAEELLVSFRLSHVRHHLPGSFSKGMQQKVMILIGLLIAPAVYVIDEPFVGLDPRATKEFLTFFDREKARGAGILISTHQLEIAEKICDSILLMAEGRIIFHGTLAEIRAQAGLADASLFDCFNQILENEGL